MANEREPFVLDFPNGQRVEDILKKADQLPTKAQLDNQLESKASMSDVQRETQSLQNQINEIVRAPESGGDVGAEVYQARVGVDGTNYQTLKGRLDAEETRVLSDIEPLHKGLDIDNILFGYLSKQIFDVEKATEHGYYNDFGIYVEHADLSGYSIWCAGYETLYLQNNIGYYLSFHTKEGTWISSLNPARPSTAISIPSDASYVRINVPTAQLDLAKVYRYGIPAEQDYRRYLDITIEKYEEHVDSITHGTNLFNKSKVTPNSRYYYSNGFYGSDYDGYAASDYIKIKPNTTYGLNVVAHICYWDADKKFISGEINTSGFHTHTTPNNAAYITISVQDLDGCMLSEGSTEKQYEPYREQLRYGIYDFKEPFQSGYIYRKFNIPKTKTFTYQTNENTAYLKLPSTYSPTGPATKLCILCHGASMGISDDGSTGWTYNAAYNRVVDQLNNYGYAVIDSNGYNDSDRSGHEHWGAPQALTGYLKAYEYFTERYNLEKTVYLYGFSMGGLTALNLAINRSFPIKCIMLGAPVISLYDQCVSGTAQSVNADFLLAYDMTSYDANKCRGYDRYLDIISVDSVPHILKTLPPIFCAYGLSDSAISNQKILDYFAALHNSNYDARVMGYSGGHEISYGGS